MNGAIAVQSQEQSEQATLIKWGTSSPPVVKYNGTCYQVYGGKGNMFGRIIEVVESDSGRFESKKNAKMTPAPDVIKQMLLKRLIQNKNKKK